VSNSASCGGTFDHRGDVSWQLFGTPECALDALDLETTGGELAGGLTGAFAVGERAAVA
jgi:hypothetical protein